MLKVNDYFLQKKKLMDNLNMIKHFNFLNIINNLSGIYQFQMYFQKHIILVH